MNQERAIFSGSGGQGLMFIGKLFANMSLLKFSHLTFFPSYGAEVRGGTSNCQVIFSGEEIPSPIVEVADGLILMNQPSTDRFIPFLEKTGAAFVNASMSSVPDAENVKGIPATEIAHTIGDVRAANVVLFGAYLKEKGFFDFDSAASHVSKAALKKGKKAEEINRKALEKGWQYFD